MKKSITLTEEEVTLLLEILSYDRPEDFDLPQHREFFIQIVTDLKNVLE